MRFVFVSLFFCKSALGGIILESTDALEVVTSTTSAIDYDCNWTDSTTSAFTPGKSSGLVNTSTTTVVVSAPAASTYRNVNQCTFRNTGGSANVLTIQKDVSANNRTKYQASLASGEQIILDQNGMFYVTNSSGQTKTIASDQNGYNGYSFGFGKGGTAKDAAGYWINYAKDAGFPGAFSLGSPGLNGVNTDCSLASSTSPAGAAQVGASLLQDPSSGAYYLSGVNIGSSNSELVQLIDVLWYNTGIVVTTTTAQTVTMGTLPARDTYGSTNGDGVFAALLTTTANTNAAAIANTTISYTDSDGNAGNTATFSALIGWQAPATPVIGTWVPFRLAAGDRGVRSVQSITLGTSYVAGALSLVLYRVLAQIPNQAALVGALGTPAEIRPSPGIRIYNDSCIWVNSVANTTTASNLWGSYTILER